MKVRGSMTVFAALLFMLVASFLFALLEAARVNTLNLYANMTSELALESVFAEYQPDLWKDYHLLGLDGAYGGRTFSEEYVTSVLAARIRKNLKASGDGKNVLGLTYASAVPVSYQLLTDGDGRVFLHAVSDYMKKSMPLGVAQELYERYISGETPQNDNLIEKSILNAKKALEENREKKQKEEVAENPFAEILACKQRILLGMVVEDVNALSIQKIDGEDGLERREKQRGITAQIAKPGWYERVLVAEYADTCFLDYSEAKEPRALAYELEYVVGGKESDRENLEVVVEQLLLVREAANVIHIMQSEEKRLAASEAAVALIGVTANPALIKVVEYGLIGAWAYAESVLDIRALLCGDKIALVKGKAQWTSSLANLPQVLDGSLRALDCENGWSYGDYLKSFLFVLSDRKLAYRMMDVMEQNLRLVYGYRNCRMDHMLCAAEYTITYETTPLFLRFSILGDDDIGKLHYENVRSFSYY